MTEQDKKKKNQAVDKIQDKFFRDIYGRPTNTVGFLKDVLPSNILKALDLTHIEVDKKAISVKNTKNTILTWW